MAALVVVLLLATLGLMISLNRSMSSKTELKIAHNDLLGKQALAIAEAGLRHAAKRIVDDSADGLSDELANNGTGGTDSGMAGFGTVTTASHACGANFRFVAFGGGSEDGYCVKVRDNFDETAVPNDPTADIDDRVELVAIGRMGTGQRTVSAMLQFNVGPDCALQVASHLDITGPVTTAGRKGCTHANGNTTISSEANLAQGATTSWIMSISGNPTMAGDYLDGSETGPYALAHSGQPTKPIPNVRPFAFGLDVNTGLPVNLASEVAAANGYLLASDGNVYQGGIWTCMEDPPDCTASGAPIDPSLWSGWLSVDTSTTPTHWKFEGGGPPSGAYFIEGWVTISSSPGSPGSPWHATFIALNSIEITGNPTLAPYTTTGNLRNLLLVSGNDIQLNGSAGVNSYQGAIFAHQQIRMNGGPAYSGFIIAENGLATWTGDPAPNCASPIDLYCDTLRGNSIDGNATITYDGLSTVGFADSIELTDWHETGN